MATVNKKPSPKTSTTKKRKRGEKPKDALPIEVLTEEPLNFSKLGGHRDGFDVPDELKTEVEIDRDEYYGGEWEQSVRKQRKKEADIMDAMEPKPVGRKTKMTHRVICKLEEASAIGCTIPEASTYAGVHESTVYRYLEANPEFRERLDGLRELVVIRSRLSVYRAVPHNPKLALELLQNKRPGEFRKRSELAGPDGQPLMNITEEKRQTVFAALAFLALPPPL